MAEHFTFLYYSAVGYIMFICFALRVCCQIKSTHGCSASGVNAYVNQVRVLVFNLVCKCCASLSQFGSLGSQVMSTTASFFRKQSWGALQLSWSTTPMIKLPYNGNACGSRTALSAWSGGDPSAIDMMAFAAASARGYNRNSFDFQLIFVVSLFLDVANSV